MTLPIYLAMTAQEMHSCASLPPHVAYMACHFSPYSTGLSDFPDDLPAGSLLIINDRIPINGHDPMEILTQLENFCQKKEPAGILLDLQRPECAESLAVAQILTQNIPLPVCVTPSYAKDLNASVFLGLPALHVPLDEHIRPWHGRKIWLDITPQCSCYRIDKNGCVCNDSTNSYTSDSLSCVPLHCHYRIEKLPDCLHITLHRTQEDLQALLTESKQLGIEKAVGLYQQLG